MSSDFVNSHATSTVGRDFMDMFLGDYIASGEFRSVYAGLDSAHVIKLETCAGSFYNVHEAYIWSRVSMNKWAKWFAPVLRISANGSILIMARTEKLQKHQLPKSVPVFFDDLKLSNWGWFEGRAVCHDYGHNLLTEHGLSEKMKKAVWE